MCLLIIYFMLHLLYLDRMLAGSWRKSLSWLSSRTFVSYPPDTTPIDEELVTKFQCNVQHLFQYTGAFPDTKLDKQWRKQIEIDKYSEIHFKEQLLCSTLSSLCLNPSYAKGGEYWKLGFVNYNLKLPATFQLPNKEDHFLLTKCTVNYFTNGIGIADMEIEWPRECVVSVEEGSPQLELDRALQPRYSLQSMLDVQRVLLDGEECKIVEITGEKVKDQENRRETKKLSLKTNFNDLFNAMISKEVDDNPFVLSWFSIDNISPTFLYSQLLLEPKLLSKESNTSVSVEVKKEDIKATPTWSHTQLSLWTYLFTSCSATSSAEVKDEFLADFLESSCYLRWASDNGGLWIGFTPHGVSSIHYADTPGDIERLKKRKSNHNPLLLSQIVNPLLYQRAYLQLEINHVRELINQTAKAKTLYNHTKISDCLKRIEGNLLRFNLIFCDEISESTAANAMVDIWHRKLSIEKLKSNLADHVVDLSSFYSGISGEAQQAKLDLLTVMIGCLGLAQLLIQISSCEMPVLAAGLTSLSIGTALFGYDVVLRRSDDHENQIIPQRKNAKPKRISIVDISPKLLRPQNQYVRVAAFSLLLTGGILISYQLQDHTFILELQSKFLSVTAGEQTEEPNP